MAHKENYEKELSPEMYKIFGKYFDIFTEDKTIPSWRVREYLEDVTFLFDKRLSAIEKQLSEAAEAK